MSLASGLKQRVATYFKNIYLDYKDAYKDVERFARRKPIRASALAGSVIFVVNLFRTNEDLRSFQAAAVSACSRVSAVVEKSRNPISYAHTQFVGELTSLCHLDQLDLGLATLVYRTDASSCLALYRHNCPYLKPTWTEFFKERIVDVGLLGHWLVLEHKMKDYDINEDDFKDLTKPLMFRGESNTSAAGA